MRVRARDKGESRIHPGDCFGNGKFGDDRLFTLAFWHSANSTLNSQKARPKGTKGRSGVGIGSLWVGLLFLCGEKEVADHRQSEWRQRHPLVCQCSGEGMARFLQVCGRGCHVSQCYLSDLKKIHANQKKQQKNPLKKESSVKLAREPA